MALPPKPTAPHLTAIRADDDTERVFEAAVAKVQRRETTAPRKGFDEQRQSDDRARPDQDHEAEDDADGDLPEELAPGAWTPFSDDD